MPAPSIIAIVKTCIAGPARWEGRMASGEGVNVRYRGSVLTVGCGPDLDAAVDASDGYERRLSEDQLDGWLDWAKAAPHVRRVQAGYVELQDRTPS